MKWSELFTSSVGKKLVMGLTGLFLISFLVVHVGINACIWANDGGVMFNKAAHFMGSMIVIRIIEVGLFVGFFIHIIQGLVLEFQNRSKRGIAIPGKARQQRKQMVQPEHGIAGNYFFILSYYSLEAVLDSFTVYRH